MITFFSQFVTVSADPADVLEAVCRFMRSFGRLQLKDWKRRRKGQVEHVMQGTLRATLSVNVADAKEKRAKRGKEARMQKQSNPAASDEEETALTTKFPIFANT